MIKLNVLNRNTNGIQFTAEIECDSDAPRSIKLGQAVAWAIKFNTNLRNADLRDTDLRGVNLRGVDLRGVN